MRESEWNLSYSANGVHPAADLTFGTFATGMYLTQPHEVTFGDVLAGEAPMPLDDGSRLGQDWQTGATVTLEIGVDAVDDAPDRLSRHGAVIDKLSLLRQAWRGDAVRSRFATPAVLRTLQGGRARRMYGRPRKFAPAASGLTRQGYTPVVAEFAMVDDLFYDDNQGVATVGIVPPPHRGIVGPLAAPLSMVGEGATKVPGEIVVGGSAAAWPIITFYGPITNPVCDLVGGWKTGLDLSLKENDRVTIDTRPWARTVLKNGTANVAGLLTRSTPKLKNLRLPLGRQDLILRGGDSTGMARMVVSWRDAYSGL